MGVAGAPSTSIPSPMPMYPSSARPTPGPDGPSGRSKSGTWLSPAVDGCRARKDAPVVCAVALERKKSFMLRESKEARRGARCGRRAKGGTMRNETRGCRTADEIVQALLRSDAGSDRARSPESSTVRWGLRGQGGLHSTTRTRLILYTRSPGPFGCRNIVGQLGRKLAIWPVAGCGLVASTRAGRIYRLVILASSVTHLPHLKGAPGSNHDEKSIFKPSFALSMHESKSKTRVMEHNIRAL